MVVIVMSQVRVIFMLDLEKGDNDMKQLTFDVNGRKIKIKTKGSTTKAGNYNGWIVTVNEVKFHFHDLITEQQAEERAYVRYVKSLD